MREYTTTLTNQGRRETEDRGESVHVCLSVLAPESSSRLLAGESEAGRAV